MFKNYLKTALRNTGKHLGYSLLNISGLALGMAGCILILLYVQFEFSFDDFHENADRIYRLTYARDIDGVTSHYAGAPTAAAAAFYENLPEIRAFTRIIPRGSELAHQGERFQDVTIVRADSLFFSLFTFEFVHGDPATALRDPYSIVMTKEMAQRIFGTESPLGKELTLPRDGDLKVTGVIKSVPSNSHFTFDFVLPMGITQRTDPGLLAYWLQPGWPAYVLLDAGTDPQVVEDKLDRIARTYAGEQATAAGTKMKYELQPLSDIHLRSQELLGDNSTGNITNVYLLSMIALFILAIACINFMNLSTARSAGRGKEVGVRKVLGAHKKLLVYQFLTESIFMALCGLPVALLAVKLALPTFNELAATQISFNYLDNWVFLASLVGLALLTGIIAGSYPAFFLSALRPVTTLKGQGNKNANHRSSFRTGLVVLQFTISIVLIVCTVIMLEQVSYMKDKKLGFDDEQIVVLPMRGMQQTMTRSLQSFKNRLLQHPGIHHASYSNGSPGWYSSSTTVYPGGSTDESNTHRFDLMMIDFDYAETYGLDVIHGRDFSKTFGSDRHDNVFLINETAAKTLGWDKDAVGKNIGVQGRDRKRYNGSIVGIVADFHYESLQKTIGPLVLPLETERQWELSLKIATKNIPETLAFIEKEWNESTDRPFNYSFVDQNFASLYGAEERLNDIVVIFSLISIFIACLGLLGLAALGAKQRTKEIGIRKVLGASASEVVLLLSTDFAKWVMLANLIAWPIAGYLMSEWLQNYAYRISLGWGVFFLSGIIALVVALFAVGTHAIKAALSNPVNALRCE